MSEYVKQRARLYKSKFRVKIKSLALEAKIIRDEERKNHGWVCGVLRWHRIDTVREEQRHTLLAYALLRGRCYGEVEHVCKVSPKAKTIERILNSLAVSPGREAIEQWLSREAKVEAA